MVGGGPLIGRESELARLRGMLVGRPVVTVTGPGGCGKTRLALELAERFTRDEVPDGARAWVPVMLAGLASAEQLPDALVRALGARERFAGSQREVLLERARSFSSLLLVLDNCEHVLAAVAKLVSELVEAVPGLRVIATSRTPLGIADEQLFVLGPLRVPQPEGGVADVVRSEAGRLFVERAAHASRAFELTAETAPAVSEICGRLDGLPLAICLAAARVRELHVSQIAGELARRGALAAPDGEDSLSAHRSLRASLEWSAELLSEPERKLLWRLSVFSGGFTVASAHAVGDPEASEEQVQGLLASLYANGLIVPMRFRGHARWTLLQTVSEYAAERLAQDGNEDERARERHLAWCQGFAAQANTLLAGTDGHAPIENETANLRSALAHALERDSATALSIASSLMRHWILAEHFQEARVAAMAVLGITGETNDPAQRALLHCGGALAQMLGEQYERALEGTRAGLALLREEQELGAQAECLRLSSMVLIQTGADLDGGLCNAERAVELARGVGDSLGLAFALVNLTTAAALCDRFDAVHACYAELLSIRPACEHVRLRSWAENAAAWAQLSAGSPQRALEHADRAIALEGEALSMTYFQLVGFRIQALARIGEPERALREATEAMRRAKESGASHAVPAIEVALMVVHLMRGDLDGAQRSAGSLLRMPHVHTVALARETLALVALARGNAVAADAQADELEKISEHSGSARHLAAAQRVRGAAAVRSGELSTGRELLHAALGGCDELGLEREAVETLEELAFAAMQAGEMARGARLAGACTAARASLQCAPTPASRSRLKHARAQIAGEAGDGAPESNGGRAGGDPLASWVQGEMLTLAEAIAYARRGRGPRDRPRAGWESLTPVEMQVAELAAEGLSNPQIAARLFIARGTVKMHLSSIYRKLKVGNRTELARIAQ